MESLIERARSFPTRVADGRTLRRLASGQSPQALFVTCSDSRVVPALITGAAPGDLFELRTAGNIVPPYPRGDRPSGEAATIEYAVEVLGVRDIVVCGHSHCGAVTAMLRPDHLDAVPAAVRSWLADSAAALRAGESATEVFDPAVAAPGQRHVLAQVARLRGYPGVARRVREGSLRLRAWFYEVHTGLVLAHRPDGDVFLPL